jgi:hypothetical protein
MVFFKESPWFFKYFCSLSLQCLFRSLLCVCGLFSLCVCRIRRGAGFAQMPPLPSRWQEQGLSISFRSCQLTSLSVLQGALKQAGAGGSAVSATDVAHLDLAENELTAVREIAPFGRLLSLDVSHNNIESLAGLPRTLVHLNASYNRLESFEGVGELTALVELNLSYNLLTDLSAVEPLAALQVLLVGGNRISSLVGLTSLTRLELLDAKFNYIERSSEVCNCPVCERGQGRVGERWESVACARSRRSHCAHALCSRPSVPRRCAFCR